MERKRDGEWGKGAGKMKERERMGEGGRDDSKEKENGDWEDGREKVKGGGEKNLGKI